jgi:hypothetical protein
VLPKEYEFSTDPEIRALEKKVRGFGRILSKKVCATLMVLLDDTARAVLQSLHGICCTSRPAQCNVIFETLYLTVCLLNYERRAWTWSRCSGPTTQS